jgi:hypothetical protein
MLPVTVPVLIIEAHITVPVYRGRTGTLYKVSAEF